jgi:hydrogenase/urease accessory protein HupE
LIILGVVLAGVAQPSRPLMYAAIMHFGFAHGNAHGLELPLAFQSRRLREWLAIASVWACLASGIALALAASRTPREDLRSASWASRAAE